MGIAIAGNRSTDADVLTQRAWSISRDRFATDITTVKSLTFQFISNSYHRCPSDLTWGSSSKFIVVKIHSQTHKFFR